MKYRLLAPGPTPVPDRVLSQMNNSIIHHRTSHFEEIFKECQEGLAWLLNESLAPLILTSSATGALEASIQNFFSLNDKVLCITGGKFGDNWFKTAQVFGLEAIEIPVEWGHSVNPEQVSLMLNRHPDCKGILLVASETSTGVKNPLEEIAILAKAQKDCLMLVDAVTALGIWPISPTLQNIDVVVGGSQKGLMLPPGLSVLWASEKAFLRQKISNLPKFYFDLNKERKAQKNAQTAHTPGVSLIMGLKEALRMMKEEGRENIFLRHERLSKACRAGIEALNLNLFSKSPSPAITSVYSPKELPPDAIYQNLQKWANFTIAGGQEALKDKIFRIGHMGYVDEIDLISILGSLEIVLKKLGYNKFNPGDSIRAASPILEEGFN